VKGKEGGEGETFYMNKKVINIIIVKIRVSFD
jgi:hypothetical protein